MPPQQKLDFVDDSRDHVVSHKVASSNNSNPDDELVLLSNIKVDLAVGPDGSTGNVTVEEAMNLPFSMKTLREAIPKECFEKSLFWSVAYGLRDWLFVATLYHYQSFFFQNLLGKVVWWNLVGFFGWCLFVIGHDCGHGSFSKYGLVNQIIGHICHAVLCVPFNGWRISHREHHQHHNHIHDDHSWRPYTKKEYIESNPWAAGYARFSPFLLFLYPIYLITESHDCGFSGNHFNPFSPMFSKEERFGGAVSSLSVMAWVAYLVCNYDAMTLLQGYVVPYFIFVAWLDLVTYMQHTDEKALYYRGSSWTYLRGALSTFDRTYRDLIDPLRLGYGRLLDHLHHNISDGHVVHHLFFTSIPHYNLIKATNALRPILGKYYRFDPTPIPVAFYKSVQACHFVDDQGEACYYHGADVAQGLMTGKPVDETADAATQQVDATDFKKEN